MRGVQNRDSKQKKGVVVAVAKLQERSDLVGCCTGDGRQSWRCLQVCESKAGSKKKEPPFRKLPLRFLCSLHYLARKNDNRPTYIAQGINLL
eukprot:1551369-Amphidinium_carterae.1